MCELTHTTKRLHFFDWLGNEIEREEPQPESSSLQQPKYDTMAKLYEMEKLKRWWYGF